MYLRIKWHEPRIVIDEASSDWNQPYPGISHSPQLLQYLWYPDLEIYEFERFGSKSILKEMSDIQIFKDKFIRYNARVDTKISCQMNFDSYPMDAHHCPFRIGSYYGTDDTVTCTSEYEYFEDRQRSLQYDIKIEPLPEKYRKWNIRKTHRFDTCGFNILINRMRTQIVFQVYKAYSYVKGKKSSNGNIYSTAHCDLTEKNVAKVVCSYVTYEELTTDIFFSLNQ